ncbi:MAG: hypothetical protein NXY57DRAFT_397821 [Lentinula lateritia]|nr:MAG: hypothetical protein NXY57DRAFT_397821 [Lentinula lateritia]
MASPINIASSGGTVEKNSPTQAESDNSARSRTVMTMLSGFANECMTEWGFYPGMTQELVTLKVENVALRSENTALRAGNAALRNTQSSMEASMKKLWQDNEILDRTLKSIGPERDFFKDRADRYHALFAASPEALPAVCRDLQQEVERLRRQYAALTSTTERLVNDGLALGVLVKTDNSPDDMSLNVHYQRPHSNTTQARTVPSNVAQNMNGATIHQQQPYVNNHSPIISNISHSSTGSIHIPSQTASQPHTVAHRTSNDSSKVMSHADHRRNSAPSISPIAHERPVASVSMPGQLLQSQYNANAPQSNRVSAQVGIHSYSQPQPSTICPYPSRTITHPKPSASSPHPFTQVQMISQGHSTPFENHSSRSSIPQSHSVPSKIQPTQLRMNPQSHSALLDNQFSRSSVPQNHSVPSHNRLSQSPMIPQEHPAPIETHAYRSSTPHSYPVPSNHQSVRSYVSSTQVSPSQNAQNPRFSNNVYQSNPSTVPQSASRMGPPSTVVYHTPVPVSSCSGVHISAQVHDAQPDDKKPIQGPAPPTPPQSDKSLSPEQEQYPTLPSPLLIRTPLKRVSIDEGIPPSPSKRMRLDGKEAATPVHSTEAPTVTQSVESMVQDDVPSPHFDQPVTGNIIVQSPNLEFVGTTVTTMKKDELVSTSHALASIEPDLENLEIPQSNLMSNNPSDPVISDVGSRQTVNNAEAEGSEDDEAGRDKGNKEEGDEDEDEEDEDESSCTEKEALEEVLKLGHSGNICKLCRARHDRYPDKYTDAVFDRDTPTSVLVSHFTTVHPAVWTRLRGSSVPTPTPTVS